MILDGDHCDAYTRSKSKGDPDSIEMVVKGIEENIKLERELHGEIRRREES